MNGHYAVLTTLTGSASANLALWTGRATAGVSFPTDAALRLPTLQLRKGTSVQRITSQTDTIKSFTFPQMTDSGGAGNKGRGQVINQNGVMTFTVEYTNRGKEIVVGDP